MKIVMVTEHYPWHPSECFVESEMVSWQDFLANHADICFTVMPKRHGINKRRLPEKVLLDLSLAKINHKKNIFFLRFLYCVYYLLFGKCNVVLIKEILSLNIYEFVKIKSAIVTLFRLNMSFTFFESYLKNNKDPDLIFYSYWFTPEVYALMLLKEKYCFKLITRTHGFDLYENAVQNNEYLPLRRFFNRGIDRIFTITDSAIDYLYNTFGIQKEIIETSRLGVIDRKIKSDISSADRFNINSCSYLVPVKRVDLIIESIAQLAGRTSSRITWTHIGDGILKDEIASLAERRLGKLRNVHYSLLGNLANNEVFEWYRNHPVDVFVNLSRSEGVPVSIMEALSCGIPVVATDVGGVSDMLEPSKNGYLIPVDSTPIEIADKLMNVHFFKNLDTRKNAYEMFAKRYSAEINFTSFINKITKKEK